MIKSLAHALRLESDTPISRLERLMLLEMLLGKPREYLLAHDDELLSEKQFDAFTMLLGLRSQGHPMAYLVGKREFFGLSFAVNQEVLIPRPETEWLVHAAIRLLPRHGTALDLGTGSGAIAIALAHHRPDARLMACDINPKALALARRNAQHLLGSGQQIRFQRSDWWEAVPLESLSLVLSNPPYLSMDDPHLMQGDLRFEPRLALSDEADGLGAIHRESLIILVGRRMACYHYLGRRIILHPICDDCQQFVMEGNIRASILEPLTIGSVMIPGRHCEGVLLEEHVRQHR